MLVDLPGYGYAKASKSLAAEWQRLIFAYLRGRANLRRVVLLIDARRGAMELDRAVMELLDEAAVSYCLALTKIDELAPRRTRADAWRRRRPRPACIPPPIPRFSRPPPSRQQGLGRRSKLHLAALAEASDSLGYKAPILPKARRWPFRTTSARTGTCG